MIETLALHDKIIAIESDFENWINNSMKTAPWQRRCHYYRLKLADIFCLPSPYFDNTLRNFLTRATNIESDYECIDAILLQLLKHKISFISFDSEIIKLISGRDYLRNIYVIDQFLRENSNWNPNSVQLGVVYELYIARKRDDLSFILSKMENTKHWNSYPFAEVFESLAYLIRNGINVENYEL